VDSSNYAVRCLLSHLDENNTEKPISFASQKLNNANQSWAAVEKESYAAMWALQKYRHWLLGHEAVVCSDQNPFTSLTEASPKSARLMRWAVR